MREQTRDCLKGDNRQVFRISRPDLLTLIERQMLISQDYFPTLMGKRRHKVQQFLRALRARILLRVSSIPYLVLDQDRQQVQARAWLLAGGRVLFAAPTLLQSFYTYRRWPERLLVLRRLVRPSLSVDPGSSFARKLIRVSKLVVESSSQNKRLRSSSLRKAINGNAY